MKSRKKNCYINRKNAEKINIVTKKRGVPEPLEPSLRTPLPNNNLANVRKSRQVKSEFGVEFLQIFSEGRAPLIHLKMPCLVARKQYFVNKVGVLV